MLPFWNGHLSAHALDKNTFYLVNVTLEEHWANIYTLIIKLNIHMSVVDSCLCPSIYTHTRSQLHDWVGPRKTRQVQLVLLLDVVGKEASRQEVRSRETPSASLGNHQGNQERRTDSLGTRFIRIPACAHTHTHTGAYRGNPSVLDSIKEPFMPKRYYSRRNVSFFHIFCW